MIYSGILVSALKVLSSLTTLTIPFAILDRPAFETIYDLKSLSSLHFSPVHPIQTNLDVAGRTPFASRRTTPLVIGWIITRGVQTTTPPSYFAYLETLISFFDFHGIEVRGVELEPFFLFYVEPPATLFTLEHFSNLVELDIGCSPERFDDTIDWLTAVMGTQVSLEDLRLTVMDEDEGFELGPDTWAGWKDGEPVFPMAELGLAWTGVRVRQVTLAFNRDNAEEDTDSDSDSISDWRTTTVDLVLPESMVITPRQIGALVQQESSAYSLTLGNPGQQGSLGWSDWVGPLERCPTPCEARLTF